MTGAPHPSRTSAVLPSDIRSAWAVSVVSLVWTTLSAIGGVALGVASGSVVLVAFGAIGVLDALGSAALAYHFRHALRRAQLSDDLERLAHRVVMFGLLAVGSGAVGGGALRLLSGAAGHSSAAGMALAAISLLVLAALSGRKQTVARRVSSPALLGDGHLSAVGAAQAAVTLAGSLTARVGWHWADPAAAMAVGVVAVTVAARMWRAEYPTRRARRTLPVRTAFLALAAVGAVDALLGPRLVLIGFLVAGPCVAASSIRPGVTAGAGAAAVGLAVVLGLPDQIWGTPEHLIWVAAVAVVAATTTVAVAVVAPRLPLVVETEPRD